MSNPSVPSSAGLLRRYARLPQLAGRSFLPIAFIARLPLAMITVGVLTLVTADAGSYALGGLAAGAVGVGSALGAPLLGYLADRLGQRPVLLVASVLQTLFILSLLSSVWLTAGYDGGATAVVLAGAVLVGATCPQVGPLARVRWMALAHRPEQRRDQELALSYESTADELTFVLGPALVGLLASLVTPWLPLVLAAVITVTLVPAFAVHPTHLLVIPLRAPAGAKKSAPGGLFGLNPVVAVPVLAMVAMGTFFGATQTALTAFGGTFGMTESAGLLYAVMGLSSAVGALSVAYWPERFSLSLRWIMSAAAMVPLALLLPLADSVPLMVLALFLLGFPVGPVMVTVFTIGGRVAPAGRLGTVMTMLASGIVAGTAVGAAVTGSIAQNTGHEQAFLVSAAAAAALLVLGFAVALVLRTRGAGQPGAQPGTQNDPQNDAQPAG